MAELKIGEVARRTGLTVRTLRHYEEIGLLPGSSRTEGKQRIYGTRELERLQRIVALRQLGLGLDEIRGLLEHPEATPLQILERHLDAIDGRIADLTRLRDRLLTVTRSLRAGDEATVEELMTTLEMMTMVEKHYTPDQLKWLAERRAAIGDERIKEVEAAWPVLIDEVLAAIDDGVEPDEPRALALADRWRGLVAEFTGGNAAIEGAVQRVWEQDGEQVAQQHGMNPRMMEAMAFIERVSR